MTCFGFNCFRNKNIDGSCKNIHTYSPLKKLRPKIVILSAFFFQKKSGWLAYSFAWFVWRVPSDEEFFSEKANTFSCHFFPISLCSNLISFAEFTIIRSHYIILQLLHTLSSPLDTIKNKKRYKCQKPSPKTKKKIFFGFNSELVHLGLASNRLDTRPHSM